MKGSGDHDFEYSSTRNCHRRFERHRLRTCQRCAEHGFDLLIAADEPAINDAAQDFHQLGVAAEAVQDDLAIQEGVDRRSAIQGGAVDALLANAGHGSGARLYRSGLQRGTPHY
jgi:NADP-dependent 3-hydroxy acid dehydrogenase YdfG